jgi:hypothetical protein
MKKFLIQPFSKSMLAASLWWRLLLVLAVLLGLWLAVYWCNLPIVLAE